MAQIFRSFDDFAIVTIRRNDCRINFCFMSNDEAVSRMNNAILNEKKDNYDYKRIIVYHSGAN